MDSANALRWKILKPDGPGAEKLFEEERAILTVSIVRAEIWFRGIGIGSGSFPSSGGG